MLCKSYNSYQLNASTLEDASKLQRVGVASEESLVGAVEVVDELLNKLTGLVAELILRRAEDRLKNGDDLLSEGVDGGLALLVELVDALVDGSVLLVVLLQGQEVDQGGKDLGKRNTIGVGKDHAGQAARSVVLDASLGNLEHGSQLVEDGLILGKVGVAVGGVEDELAGSVGSVALGLVVGIGETLEEQVHELAGVGGDGGTHVGSALSNHTDTGGALEVLGLGGSELQDGLLEDLPELREGRAKSDGEADDNIEGSVNNKPVVLGRALNLLLLVLITKILLARVRAGDDGAEDADGLLHELALGKDGRAAGLESGGNVAVDLGNDGTFQQLASCCKSWLIIRGRM